VAADDEKRPLPGGLESRFGQRQRGMNGLHLDEGAAADTQAEMLQLQREIQGRFTRGQPSPRRRLGNRYVRGVLRAVGLFAIAVCAAAVVILVFG